MKVCFWGNISGAINDNPVGGGEVQISLLARTLAKAGHEVVVVDYTISDDYVTSDGIKVFCIKGYNNGIRIIRTFTHRLKLIYSSLRDQKADIYYCRVRDFRHILAYWAARKVNAKFILGTASDLDVVSFRIRLKYLYFAGLGGMWWFFSSFLSELVYPWLLRNSDLVLVQHEGQKNILLEKNVKSKVLKSLIDLKAMPVILNCEKKDFSYVGALDKRKGFAEFFQLIEKAPMHTFKIIGEPRDKLGQKYYNKLKSFSNVTLCGKLSHTDTLFHIVNSKALISTSPMEGFPNIFLEAWSSGIPVLSLFIDPGDIIEKENLGVVTKGDLEKLFQALNNVGNNTDIVNRGKSYIERNHVLNENKIKEIDKLFVDLVQREQI